MTEPTAGEQKTTDKTTPSTKLSEAVRIVRKAIEAEENRLREISGNERHDPVMLEGETSTGYYVQMMIEPAKVTQIMLDYEYPLYKVLEEEAPQGMWDELAKLVGLDNILSVDL